MKAPLIYLFFLLFAFNFSADDFNHEEQRMLSTLYVQTAAEHRASVLQTFKTATNLLPEAIEDASWNALPNLASIDRDLAPAIMLRMVNINSLAFTQKKLEALCPIG